MKRKVIFIALLLLFVGTGLHADPGDLTVEGNLVVNGDLVADNKIKYGRQPNEANWITVAYNTPFVLPGGVNPVVVATAERTGTSTAIVFVVIKDNTPSGFKMRVFNNDGIAGTSAAVYVSWIAIAP